MLTLGGQAQGTSALLTCMAPLLCEGRGRTARGRRCRLVGQVSRQGATQPVSFPFGGSVPPPGKWGSACISGLLDDVKYSAHREP